MIEFTDITMREAEGNFKKLSDLMGTPSWMIKTTAYLTHENISNVFILHCWNTGDVYIMNSDLDQGRDASNQMIYMFDEWIKNNSWSRLCVHRDMIDSPDQYEFWLRTYRSGLVYNKTFEEEEKREMKKYEKIVNSSQDENNEEEEQ